MSQKDAVFEAYIDFAEHTAEDQDSQSILHLPYSGGEFLLKTIFSNGAAVVDPPAFDNFFAVEHTSTTVRSTNISDLTLENSGNQPVGI